MSFLRCLCSSSLFRKSNDENNDDDRQSNSQSQSQSQSVSEDSFNSSSFSSGSSLPPSISSIIPPPPTTTISSAHHHCLSTFKPNSSHIFSLTFTGNLLFSGSSNSQIHLWPRYPASTTTVSVPCTSAVKSLLILKDSLLISAHQDHKIRIWKVDQNSTAPQRRIKNITTLPSFNDRLSKVFFSKNYVEVRRHKKCTWVHHVDAVSSLALSPDQSVMYSASWDRSFKVWRTSDFKCLESVWNAHDDAINAIVASDEGFVYTGSADKKIKVWRRNKGDRKHSLVDTLEQHKSAVNALACDGQVLYSGACSGVVIVWERNSGGHMMVEGALLGHKKAVLCVRTVSELVCSGSADMTIRLWRRGAGKRYLCLGVLEGHNGPVKCLAMNVEKRFDEEEGEGNGYMIYSGSLDCDVKVWKVWVPFSLA